MEPEIKATEETEAPYWWEKYKLDNPTDKEEYNPKKHCCRRFWKDFCECV